MKGSSTKSGANPSPNPAANSANAGPAAAADAATLDARFEAFAAKMRAAQCDDAAIGAFRANFEKLVGGDTGLMPESTIDAVSSLPRYEADIKGLAARSNQEDVQKALAQTVVLKLNGGLGTSMGLEKAKSLLEVKNGETFLTLIAKQIKHIRTATGSHVKFMLMNSFSTSTDSMAALRASGHADLASEPFVELMQNKSPKVDAATMLPAVCASDPELEWCPPGHGDLYAALLGSGTLDALLKQGTRYVFVSNSDNLGATLDVDLLYHFVSSGKPFLMEVAERTEADKKGGHLAFLKGTSQLVLRESAMCPKEDTEAFQNIALHKFFNTNSIYLDLEQVQRVMQENNGRMPLPLIKNKKTVDPRDPASTSVFQLETAMGAAIESFQASGAVVVPRDRFAPVKTTSDLFTLRSDAYVMTPDFQIRLAEGLSAAPVVSLDDKYYKLVDQLDALVAKPPSLLECKRLRVTGPAKFLRAESIVVVGDATIAVQGDVPKVVPSGRIEGPECKL